MPKLSTLIREAQKEIPSQEIALITKRNVKVRARKNELVCETCGGMVFNARICNDKIMLECIGCMESLPVKGVAKTLRALRDGNYQNRKLLLAGQLRPEKKRLRTITSEAKLLPDRSNLPYREQNENANY